MSEEISCVADGPALRLDTPYVLQDGRLLRVYLRPAANNGGLVASDGGYATSQVEIFARSAASMRERYEEMKQIAHSLDLEWDTEFRYYAPGLGEAVRRLGVLARAVDRTLTLFSKQRARPASPIKKLLASQFQSYGLIVRNREKIPLPDGRHVTVDQLVRRNGSQAAVEVLTAKTRGGAVIAVDHAIGNFHQLRWAKFGGIMAGVYDESSPAVEVDLRKRFETSLPESTLLLAGSEAAGRLAERLKASG